MEEREYSLSNDVVVVTRVHLEVAVVCPEIDRVCDAGYAALVDLLRISGVVAK
jgi:hypothetical protein